MMPPKTFVCWVIVSYFCGIFWKPFSTPTCEDLPQERSKEIPTRRIQIGPFLTFSSLGGSFSLPLWRKVKKQEDVVIVFETKWIPWGLEDEFRFQNAFLACTILVFKGSARQWWAPLVKRDFNPGSPEYLQRREFAGLHATTIASFTLRQKKGHQVSRDEALMPWILGEF